MKNGNKKGFEQCYNGQAAVDQASRLIVGNILSNRPNGKLDAIPVIDAIPQELGKPAAAALDNGYMSPTNIDELEERGITPYIATGRDSHHFDLDSLLTSELEPPLDNANHIVKMIYALNTEAGKAIYKLRKSTVEPVFGIIKEVMGFRQFSLRGLAAAAGEWNLVCLAYNLKRLHVMGALASFCAPTIGSRSTSSGAYGFITHHYVNTKLDDIHFLHFDVLFSCSMHAALSLRQADRDFCFFMVFVAWVAGRSMLLGDLAVPS